MYTKSLKGSCTNICTFFTKASVNCQKCKQTHTNVMTGVFKAFSVNPGAFSQETEYQNSISLSRTLLNYLNVQEISCTSLIGFYWLSIRSASTVFYQILSTLETLSYTRSKEQKVEIKKKKHRMKFYCKARGI